MKMFVKKRPTVVEDAVPATVEQAIPISDVYEDGICLVGRNLWSKTFKFSDINYATASKGDKENMFFAYSAILNSFDTGAMTKITINNRRMNQSKFEKESMLELCGDSLDRYRTEYNRILADNANMSSGITQDKYLTVTVEKKSIEEARTYFNRIYAEYSALFSALGSRLEEVEAEEKLRIIFDFFHYGSEEDYHYDASRYEKRGYGLLDRGTESHIQVQARNCSFEGRVYLLPPKYRTP